jgi:hypothetical protein
MKVARLSALRTGYLYPQEIRMKVHTKDIHQINVDGTITPDGRIIADSFNNYSTLYQ